MQRLHALRAARSLSNLAHTAWRSGDIPGSRSSTPQRTLPEHFREYSLDWRGRQRTRLPEENLMVIDRLPSPMYTQLAEIPTPVSAAFLNDNAAQITYTARNFASNSKKTLTKVVALNATTPTNFPLQDVGETVASVISSSYNFRAILRESKQGTSTKRFVEIWFKNRIEVSLEVSDFHQAFYLDENLFTLTFSPSETALLYTAEANAPTNTTDDPYAKFRYKPSFGETFGGKKLPRFFLLRWRAPNDLLDVPSKPQLYEIKPESDDVLFGQGIFFPNAEENIIYATGYEYTPNGRLLGVRGCFNRPFGIWELCFRESDVKSETEKEKKLNLTIYTARKISDQNSARSPRILVEGPKVTLYWLSSNAGGPHTSTTAIESTELTPPKNTTADVGTRSIVLVPMTRSGDFPGLYPPFNMSPYPFLQSEGGRSKIIIQSQSGFKTNLLSVSVADGSIQDITPPDPALFNWALLATDGKSRIICSRSSPAVPYEIFLGVVSDNGIQWSALDEPDLAPDISSALQTIRTNIYQIPDRWPLETMVIRSTRDEPQGPPPLITDVHGGPHASYTVSFSPANTAWVLEGYTLSLPNYTGSPGYGQDNIYKLLGKCGTLDVEDVHASTLYVINDLRLARFGKGEVFVMGGSHGGFITAHLVSRYPDIYSAAVLRNPVITCGEISGTDIPDWYFAEFGFQDDYPIKSCPPSSTLSTISDSSRLRDHDLAPHVTPRLFEVLYASSPSTALVNYLEKRRQQKEDSKRIPPILLAIGASDQRVSPTQGIGFYHLLKGAGETVELLIFDGEGHPLDGVEAAKATWEAARDWLKRFGRKGM